jgi:hypothetical protein
MRIIVAVLAAVLLLAGCSPGTKTVAGPTVTATATVAGPTTTATVTTTPTKVIATRILTHVVTYTPPVKVAFGDGTFRVGSEIAPGTYHTNPAGSACYWERDGRGTDNIIANDNITGPTTIDIASSDYAFTSSGGCDWVRV